MIEQYNKEQEKSKEANLKNAGITLHDDIYDLYSKGLISSKLTLNLALHFFIAKLSGKIFAKRLVILLWKSRHNVTDD